MIQSTIINDLKKKGFKMTRARAALVDLFLEATQPISVPEITSRLKDKNLIVNKTTIYRELDFLLDQQLVRQVDLRERGKKFEYNLKAHHHHLVCIKCKKVEDFELGQDLDEMEGNIEKLKQFKVLNHSLEFFGICSKCSNYLQPSEALH